ncbi:hypothetical protein BH09MYX1_BH09MYX1_64870 [soil metagenome]
MLVAEIERQRAFVEDGWIERDVNGTDSGLHALVEIVTSFDRRGVRDYRWTITRLGEARAWADRYVTLLRRGLEHERVATAAAVRSAMRSVDAMLAVDRPKNPFRMLVREVATVFATRGALEELRSALLRALEREVVPALRSIRMFLAREYLPRAPRHVEEAIYRHHLARHLGPDHLSPDALRRWGAAEVSRWQRDLGAAVVIAFGLATSLPRAMARIARDPALRFGGEDELLRVARTELVRARAIAERVMTVPEGALRVERVPAHLETTMLAQYLTPRGGEGTLQLNTTKLLRAQRRHELPTLITHEAFGGHHVAAIHAESRMGLPELRRFANVSAFDEGWALYAEQVRDELGGFDPIERIGYLGQQLWRAARLVIDTSLHDGTMSQAAAVSYLERVVFLPPARARAEVRRYLDCPAQALAYYVGKAHFLETRAEAKRILGSDFDLRRFHDKLLSLCAVPLNEARAEILIWASKATHR